MTAVEGVRVGHQADSRGRAFQAEVTARADPTLEMGICTAKWLELNGPRGKTRVRLAGRLEHVWAGLCKSEEAVFYSVGEKTLRDFSPSLREGGPGNMNSRRGKKENRPGKRTEASLGQR